MKIIECEQYSTLWWAARRGLPTASSMDRIFTPKTAKLSKSIDEYAAELVADKFAPVNDDAQMMTKAMMHGLECEPEARSWYEFNADVDVRQVGFCLSDCGRFGCSPDGLVGEDGGLELKCPQPKTQVSYLIDGGLPDEYRVQVHGSLIVTGRAWWDFVSYARGLPPLRVRVVPDGYTELLRAALEAFHMRLVEIETKILALQPNPGE